MVLGAGSENYSGKKIPWSYDRKSSNLFAPKCIILFLLLLSVVITVYGLTIGPKEVTEAEMEKEIDAFQEKYNIKEIEIDEIFRNKDKSKWKN